MKPFIQTTLFIIFLISVIYLSNHDLAIVDQFGEWLVSKL